MLDPGAPLYTPDFVGYAVQRLEREWATSDAQPVIGFFNGAEGDITARRTRRDLLDTARLGLLFAEEIKVALAKAPVLVEAEPTLTVSGVLVKAGGKEPVGCGASTLASRPMFGAAALGGAEDDRLALYQLGWKEGVVDRYTEGQGPKLPGLDSRLIRAMHFSDLIAKPEAFPDTIPVARASIGSFSLAAIPVEMSTAQGQSIRRALQLPHGRLELIGLANDYHSYCASPDEYSAQDYMGASTIWGPQEGPFLTCLLVLCALRAQQRSAREGRPGVAWPVRRRRCTHRHRGPCQVGLGERRAARAAGLQACHAARTARRTSPRKY